jgi:hypothetical protein
MGNTNHSVVIFGSNGYECIMERPEVNAGKEILGYILKPALIIFLESLQV